MSFLARATRRLVVGKGQEFVFRSPSCVDSKANQVDEAGLYIHIPFCKSMCPYCPYNKVQYEKGLAGEYQRALLAEVDLWGNRLGRIAVSSVYIGGGTPTLMLDELEAVLAEVRRRFRVQGPICLETTPVDLTQENLKKIRDYGVEQISVGVQSFNPEHLKLLGRPYEPDIALEAVSRAVEADFATVNLDLIFAFSGQSQEQLKADLDTAFATGAGQVTAYPLMTFPYTPVGRHVKLQKVKTPNLLERRRLYRTLHRHCTDQGFERASVWGFKKKGNSLYSSVTRDHFCGLGAGAASHIAGKFSFNTFNVEQYNRAAVNGENPRALEMKVGSGLQAIYWLYWRLYETHGSEQAVKDIFGENRKTVDLAIRATKLLGLTKRRSNLLTLTERGAFWIHLLQNQYVLNYIDKVWTKAMKEPWPEAISI